MRYFSDITKKLYETEEALINAETEVLDARKAKKEKEEKLKKEKECRIIALKAALEECEKAQKNAEMLLEDYIKDYGKDFFYQKKSPSLFKFID